MILQNPSLIYTHPVQLTADTAERLCPVSTMDTHTMILKSPFLFLQVSMNSFVGDCSSLCAAQETAQL